jgi:hypothetical protein
MPHPTGNSETQLFFSIFELDIKERKLALRQLKSAFSKRYVRPWKYSNYNKIDQYNKKIEWINNIINTSSVEEIYKWTYILKGEYNTISSRILDSYEKLKNLQKEYSDHLYTSLFEPLAISRKSFNEMNVSGKVVHELYQDEDIEDALERIECETDFLLKNKDFNYNENINDKVLNRIGISIFFILYRFFSFIFGSHENQNIEDNPDKDIFENISIATDTSVIQVKEEVFVRSKVQNKDDEANNLREEEKIQSRQLGFF